MTPRIEQIGDATLYLGDCREILPTLTGVDAVVTDPPYGEGMGFDGDNDPRDAAALAGAAFRLLRTAASPGAYAACFWTMRSLDLLFDEVRAVGWSYTRTLTMHVPGTARPHLAWVPRIQPIVLFRNCASRSDLHDRLSVWLKARMDASGMTAADISRDLGCDSRLVMKWSRYRDPAWCLPTQRFWLRLKEILCLSDEFDLELLSCGSSEHDRDWDYRQDLYSVSDGKKVSGHPSEKPIEVLMHIAGSLARQNETVLDSFMGSGTTGVACARLARKFVGVETDPKYFDIACRRIEQAQQQPDMLREAERRTAKERQMDMLC